MDLQKIKEQKLFNYVLAIVSVPVFVIVAIRSTVIPFCHDEVATFIYYIQTGDFLPYHAHPDANNHILNSCLAWICFNLFGDSLFALRLPNLLALILLIYAVYRTSRKLTHLHSKLILVAGFLLSFHWLSFYSVCRGYGLSTALLVLSISYLIEYFDSKKLAKLCLFYLFIQLAISASMILVIIALVLTFAVFIFNLLHKELLKTGNIFLFILHGMLLAFWLKFSFSMQTGGHFYLGSGKSYWNTTFVTLIELLSGSNNRLLPFFILLCFVVLIGITITINTKTTKINIRNLFKPSLFYSLLLLCLICVFYAMKLFLNINYPEDRTGLFFYVYFVLAIAFTLDLIFGAPVKILTGLIMVGALIHFAIFLNFRKHSLDGYQTIPERFYTRLLDEQKQSADRITIGGQSAELIYDFINYRNGGQLTNLDASFNNMEMNSDYAIFFKTFEKYYSRYYDVIDMDKDWGIALLKRKEKIKRTLLKTVDSLKVLQGHDEYYNLYAVNDTVMKNTNPLLMEVNIGRINAAMPMQVWLVLEVDSTEGHAECYKRIPLNWLRYDWSNVQDQKLYITTCPLPTKTNRLICYLWNIDKKEIKFNINWVKIYRLDGDGVNVVSPEIKWDR
jgi:hypothetical protein